MYLPSKSSRYIGLVNEVVEYKIYVCSRSHLHISYDEKDSQVLLRTLEIETIAFPPVYDFWKRLCQYAYAKYLGHPSQDYNV